MIETSVILPSGGKTGNFGKIYKAISFHFLNSAHKSTTLGMIDFCFSVDPIINI